MQWFDFKPGTGSHLLAFANRKGEWFFVVPDKDNALDAGIQKRLGECGFMQVRGRWVAPMTWGCASRIRDIMRDDIQEIEAEMAQKGDSPVVMPVSILERQEQESNQSAEAGKDTGQDEVGQSAAPENEQQRPDEISGSQSNEEQQLDSAMSDLVRISRMVAELSDEELRELRNNSTGSTENIQEPMEVKFILKGMSDTFYYQLSQIGSPQDKYNFLSSHFSNRGTINSVRKIGSGAFRDRVDLNRAINDDAEFEHFDLTPRRGYAVATFAIDLKPKQDVSQEISETQEPSPSAEEQSEEQALSEEAEAQPQSDSGDEQDVAQSADPGQQASLLSARIENVDPAALREAPEIKSIVPSDTVYRVEGSDMLITGNLMDKTGLDALKDHSFAQRALQSSSALRVFEDPLGSRERVEPLAIFSPEDEETDSYVLLSSADKENTVSINPNYLRHFYSKYPDAQFYASLKDNQNDSVLVYSGGERVGVVLPLYFTNPLQKSAVEQALEETKANQLSQTDEGAAEKVLQDFKDLEPFIPASQLAVIRENLAGEEGNYFRDKLSEYATKVKSMPQTYEQDGLGDDAVCHLHYFSGSSDWYITERDSEDEQYQAYGFAILNGDTQNAEAGYISIEELKTLPGVEIDLHFEPMYLRQVKEKHGINDPDNDPDPGPGTGMEETDTPIEEVQADDADLGPGQEPQMTMAERVQIIRDSVEPQAEQEVIAQFPETPDIGLRREWRDRAVYMDAHIKGKITEKKVQALLEKTIKELEGDVERYEDLRSNGVGAVSDYDIGIASSENALDALHTALSLKSAHISYNNTVILQARAYLEGDNLNAMPDPEDDPGNQENVSEPQETLQADDDDFVANPEHFRLSNDINRAGESFNPSQRAQENIEAIKLLKELESSGAHANEAQKQILSRYNGFGALEKVFGSPWMMNSQPQWVRETREQLLELMQIEDPYNASDNEEWASAQGSIVNAHFTDLDVCRSIWKGIEASGIPETSKHGDVLEPSMGSGNFLGTAPESIVRNFKINGVEKDLLTGRIAQQLYPDANVHISGYEDVALPNNYFDIAVSNVPFGNFSAHDERYPELTNFSIHNYFIIKTLEKAKPDGVCAFITSSYTMNGKNSVARKEMARRGELVGAVRMPNTAQKGQAGTEVVTDVLFFKPYAKPQELSEDQMPSWVFTEDVDISQDISPYAMNQTASVNKYFIENPEHVLGKQEVQSSRFGYELTVNEDDANWRQRLGSICEQFGASIKQSNDAQKKSKVYNPAVQGQESMINVDKSIFEKTGGEPLPGLIVERDSEFWQVNYTMDGMERYSVPNKKSEERLRGLLQVREALLDVVGKNADERYTEQDRTEARQRLNDEYDSFVKKYGCINKGVNARLIQDDPYYGLMCGSEHYDPKADTAQKADVFSRDLKRRVEEVTSVDTVSEALAASLSRNASIDLDYMASLLDRDKEDVTREAIESEIIYYNPYSNDYEVAAQYLSGDVRRKLRQAQEGVELNTDLRRNVEALEKVQPEDVPAEEIRLRIGAQWVPVADVEEYFYTKCREHLPHLSRSDIVVDLVPGLGTWTLDVPSAVRSHYAFSSELGTDRRPMHNLFDRLLNQKSVAVYDQIEDSEGNKTRVLNQEETLMAEEKAALLQNDFFDYMLLKDEERSERLAKIYNEKFNCFVSPQYDGSVLSFPDMNANIELREHQKNAVLRVLLEGNTMFAHEVGTGKTMCQVATAMESKRLGRSAKPMIAVKNNTIDQINREANELYPGKKILVVQKEDLQKNNRKKLFGKIANNDWDLIVISHSQFKRLPLSKDLQEKYVNEELANLREVMDRQKMKGEIKKSEKEIEKALKRQESKLKKKLGSIKKAQDFGVNFDDLGVDMVLFDESHNLKNLATGQVSTQFSDNISGSDMAYDFYMKSRFIEENLNGVSVFSTGTPVSNNVLELFNIQRFLQRSMLKEKGLGDMASWGATFLAPKTELEPKPGGNGWQSKTRASLINVPELMQSIRHCADIVKAKDVSAIKRPEVERKNIVVDQSPIQEKIMEYLNWRVSKLSGKDSSEDNILCIVTDGRKLAADPRLFNDMLPDYPELDSEVESKASQCAKQASRIYTEKQDIKGTQLVFCDMGVYKKGHFNIYDDLRAKMVSQGIPDEEIAYVHEYDSTDAKKRELSQKVNSGEIRVLIGNTQKMGEGSNFQERLAAVHHFDPPWRPSDIEQRVGRMERQGNMNEDCENLIYTTRDTFDLFMWKTLQRKAEMFGQLFSGEAQVREFDLDINPTYAETAALTSGNELLKSQIETDQKIQKLEAKKRAHYSNIRNAKFRLDGSAFRLDSLNDTLNMYKDLQKSYDADGAKGASELTWSLDLTPHKDLLKDKIKDKDAKQVIITGEREKIAQAANYMFKEHKINPVEGITVCGLPVSVDKGHFNEKGQRESHWVVETKSGASYTWKRPSGIENTLLGLEPSIESIRREIEHVSSEADKIRAAIDKNFEHDDELANAYKERSRIALEIKEQESQASQEECGEYPEDFLYNVENFADVLPEDYFEASVKSFEDMLNRQEESDDESENNGDFPDELLSAEQEEAESSVCFK